MSVTQLTESNGDFKLVHEDGSESNMFKFSKENMHQRGKVALEADLVGLADAADGDLVFVVEHGAIWAFNNGVWGHSGPARLTHDDVEHHVELKELNKAFAGLPAFINDLRVENF